MGQVDGLRGKRVGANDKITTSYYRCRFNKVLKILHINNPIFIHRITYFEQTMENFSKILWGRNFHTLNVFQKIILT